LLTKSNSTIYQTYEYGLVRYGEKNISNIVIYSDNKVIGAAQIRFINIPLVKKKIAHIKFGPLWKLKGEEESLDNFNSIIECIRYVLGDVNGFCINILLNEYNYENEFIENITKIFLSHNFCISKKVGTERTLVLDTSCSLDEVRKSFSTNWRNMLNKAEKNDLEIVQSTGDELFDIFLDMHQQTVERKNFISGVNYFEYKKIQNLLPEKYKIQIFTCLKDGKSIGSASVSAIGNKGIYIMAATGNEWKELPKAYILQWSIIKWLKERGVVSYDLGGINPVENPSVFHFKNGLAGKRGKDLYYFKPMQYYPNVSTKLFMRFFNKMILLHSFLQLKGIIKNK